MGDARDAAAEAIAALANAGELRGYTGTPPATPGDLAGGTLLFTITLPGPAFGSASGGQVTAQGLPLSATAVASGTVGWVRVVNSIGNGVWDDADVGTAGQSVEFDSLAIEEHGEVTVTSWTCTVPEA